VSITAAIDDGEEPSAETVAYCKKHQGARFKSFEAADDYIRKVSDGQTFGFEIEE
jgi:hypothetical protein